MPLIPLLDNLLLKPFMGEILSSTLSISFKSNFELTSKQPVNATSNKLINFAFNLPLSTLEMHSGSAIATFEQQDQLQSFRKGSLVHSKSNQLVYTREKLILLQNLSIFKTTWSGKGRILDARLRKGKLQYLVDWAGHQLDENQTSWETAAI
ncbi:chromo (CHRromatin Organization MOdifier) domain protein [Puccinia sorghi]|uniref:Chromo (CHRromatin Organization MOdifier) domain protein n=1 Tax=Puccinia sorghi TaxID=27349 RepID=A0A0L6UM50_9BASI|nr:chromo (CHRromatin Organization MOdifier) domain protein [Puccinia sorghi]